MAKIVFINVLLLPSAYCFSFTHSIGGSHPRISLTNAYKSFASRERPAPTLRTLMSEKSDVSRKDVLSALIAGTLPMILGVQSAYAQFPLLDTRGERPAGLGPIAGGRFLSLCSNENCVSTSEGE